MSEHFRCTNCSHDTRSSLDVARTLGWRIWDGESVTGKPLKVRICPTCVSGDAEEKREPSWGVGCRTCDWEYEDWGDEGPLTEKAAREVAGDHECEPDTWVKSPEEMEKERARWERARPVETVEIAGVSR